MRFAFADPPYPGMAHLYKDHPDYGGEVDHVALIARLVAEFPDGWALSTGERSLQDVLSFAPRGCRVLAWCRTFPPPMGYPCYNWEPVIMTGGRKLKGYTPKSFTVVDHEATAGLRGQSFTGKKPEGFCFWLFRCLGALPGDELADLFPGSGAVSRAWDQYQRQMTLPTLTETGKQVRLEAIG